MWESYGVFRLLTILMSEMPNCQTKRHRGIAVSVMMQVFNNCGAGVVRALVVIAATLASVSAVEPVRSLADLQKLERRVTAVYEQAMPATVVLNSEGTGAAGSGVVVSKDGLILTAAHVVMGVEEVQVLFPDGSEYSGKVLGANRSRDEAMVRIMEPGPFPFVELGESGTREIGDWVVALGHSAGFDPARTPPLRFGRVISKGPGEVLTSDCTLIGGDSGGPLFDLDGKVVAIHSSIGGALNNNNHAGIDGFRKDWERLSDGEWWGRLSLNPLVNLDAPVLGFQIAGALGGVGVGEVLPNSPAARAGLREGDRVFEIDGARVTNQEELLIELARRKPGDKVRLAVRRGVRKLEMEAELVRRGNFYKEN